MRNRTKAFAAAAVAAALAAGGTAGAMASTAGAEPGAHATTVSATKKAPDSNGVAAQLGVSQARLDQALRAAKESLSKAGNATPDQFDATLARILGIPLARVRHALPPEPAGGAKVGGPKVGGSRAAASGAKAKAPGGTQALTAAVASELHVTKARVAAALRPMFEAGYVDPSSPAFVAAARSLGVSTAQLQAALTHAKESLGAGS